MLLVLRSRLQRREPRVCVELLGAGGSIRREVPAVIKHKGSKSYTVEGEAAYQRELMAHGPFEVGFDVYADWPAYKSGVYTQTSDEHLGGHAVKIVGWGSMNGVKYWKMLNLKRHG